MSIACAILGLVVLQRIGELWYASRNTSALKARGALEYGHAHYPLIVLLHAAWLTAIASGIRRDPGVHSIPLVVFAALQAMRIWVIATLGPYWTTRIISVPGEPLVRRGPYRFVRHPNYLVVAGEMAVFPLVFGQITNAVVFSALNAVLLAWRIRQENAVLDRHAHRQSPADVRDAR
jgi:methyltransferase